MGVTPAGAIRESLVPITHELLQSEVFWNHHRLQTYALKGCACVVPGCHRVATHVLTWKERYKGKNPDPERGRHIDLIGYEPDGEEFLMTSDHIIPRAMGGSDLGSNRQPMCQYHNSKKGHKLIHIPDGHNTEGLVFRPAPNKNSRPVKSSATKATTKIVEPVCNRLSLEELKLELGNSASTATDFHEK